MTDHIETSKIRDLIKDMQADMNVQLGGEFYEGYDTATADWKHHLEALLPPRALADLTDGERADCQWMQAETEDSDDGELGIILWVAEDSCSVLYPDGKVSLACPIGMITPRFDLPKLNPWDKAEEQDDAQEGGIPDSLETVKERNPDDVDPQIGEAWVVKIIETDEAVAAILDRDRDWFATDSRGQGRWYNDARDVTPLYRLVAPEQPAPSTAPRTVTTEQEYDALPVGSIVAEDMWPPYLRSSRGDYHRADQRPNSFFHSMTPYEASGTTRRVLREGWEA